MKCPICIKELTPYGGRRARNIDSSHTLWYILWFECDECEYSFQTVEEVVE